MPQDQSTKEREPRCVLKRQLMAEQWESEPTDEDLQMMANLEIELSEFAESVKKWRA